MAEGSESQPVVDSVTVLKGADHAPSALQQNVAAGLNVDVNEVTPDAQKTVSKDPLVSVPGGETPFEDFREDLKGPDVRITDSGKGLRWIWEKLKKKNPQGEIELKEAA